MAYRSTDLEVEISARARAGEPFIVLDDARAGAGALLYDDPVDTVVAWTLDEVETALTKAQFANAAGLHVAGYLAYEAGAAFEPKLAEIARHEHLEEPLIWFGLFGRAKRVLNLAAALPEPAFETGAVTIDCAEGAYRESVERALDFIRAGDIYQANITFPAHVPLAGDPLAHYARLRRAQSAGWGGIVFTGDRWLLSCSPELYFTLEAGRLLAKPMKGTAARSSNVVEDLKSAEWLRQNPKDRAENVMIVDLLRNDISRVAKPASVRVSALFDVETYPTIHQMTSSITADLRQGASPHDVLRATFPCGSVTGAPKIRAMEIIDALEGRRRRAYTGSIGVVDPDGDAAFNVAIRTLEYRSGEDKARLCVGSGIVADSDPGAEWSECLSKLAFVSKRSSPDEPTTFQKISSDSAICEQGSTRRLQE